MSQEIIRLDLTGVNAYLIKNNNQFILVDTGGSTFFDKPFTNRRDKLEFLLKINGVTNDNLKLIILTHGDCDHVSNAAYISHRYNAPIAMSKHDGKLVNNPQINDILSNSKYESMALKIVFHIMRKKIIKLVKKIQSEFESFVPDIFVEEGNTLEKYGFDGTVVYTPGHTAGSISIVTGDRDVICGDILSNNKKPDIAMNAQDFTMLRKSIAKLSKYDPVKIYPGHGEPFAYSEYLKNA